MGKAGAWVWVAGREKGDDEEGVKEGEKRMTGEAGGPRESQGRNRNIKKGQIRAENDRERLGGTGERQGKTELAGRDKERQ